MNKDQGYLQDILERIRMIEEFTASGRDQFLESRMAQEAVIRCYEVIGEIVKRLDPVMLAQQPQMTWREIIAFRDFLIHNYERVRLDIVWSAVEQLPELRAAIESMLNSLPPDSSSP